MTIDEAITHCEEVAKEQRELFSLCPIPSEMCDPTDYCASLKDGKSKGCIKCAEEHEQLAKWLKELKTIKEKDCNDIEEIVSTLEYIKEYCHAGHEEDALDKAIEMFSKREFHADHTDCIWYRSDKKHTDCPVTCSQYRDGWNDAMRYVYENGKGYKPYRRS